jgi:hypothetical protein
MDRGLRAQLSPNEETTLQRVARPEVAHDERRAHHVAPLLALQRLNRTAAG